MKKLIVTMGLPSSGKSFWATNECSATSFFDVLKRLDLDELIQKHKKYNKCSDDKALEYVVKNYFDSTSTNYIVDGLFLNNVDVISFLKIVKSTSAKINSVEIHYWTPNVEACLWNDQFRREKDSKITIQNATFESPDVKLIKTETGFSIKAIQHTVVRKPLYKVYCDKNGINLTNDRYMRSSMWSLGGTWKSYTGSGGTISPDSPLTTFEEFDNIMEDICPDINFMKYKKLYNKCVDSDTYSENDYYGGSTETAYLQCDMQLLFKELLEMELINEEDILK